MDNEGFRKLVDRRCDQSREVLAGKAREYASDADRFHNFNVAGAAKGETPEQALWGMYMKHWVSIQDMVKSGEAPGRAWIDEKIGDSINYLMLLEGLFSQRLLGGQNGVVSAKELCEVGQSVGEGSAGDVDPPLPIPTIEENAKRWSEQA